MGTDVRILNRYKPNAIGIICHLLAVILIVGGLVDVYDSFTISAVQQTVQALLGITYILIAMFLELVALNFRNLDEGFDN